MTDTMHPTPTATHHARVSACLALARDGLLGDDVTIGLADALDCLGIRPPARYRPGYPGLCAYAADLLEAATDVDALERDPGGAAEGYVDDGQLRPGVTLDAVGRRLLDDKRDELDALIGESYDATTRANR